MRVLRHLGRVGGGRATGALRVWLWWEAFYVRRLRSLRPQGLVRFTTEVYRGPPISLEDATLIRRHDRLVQLHLDNRTLLRLASGGAFDAFGTERMGTAELRQLAAMVAHDELGPVNGLHAVTPFAPALRRQGFEVRPVAHTFGYAMERFYMSGLFAIYHPRGWAALTPQRARRWPSEVWMSRERFLARFGSPETPVGDS